MKKSVSELRALPNVGPAVAEDLSHIGITRVAQLAGKDPEKLYLKLEQYEGAHVDRCMLYVLRSLVYMAETGDRRPDRVKWWLFKDGV